MKEGSESRNNPPDYVKLRANFKAALANLLAVLEMPSTIDPAEKEKRRSEVRRLVQEKLEIRTAFFAPLVARIKQLIKEKIGNIEEVEKKFVLKFGASDLTGQVPTAVLEVFEEESFEGFSALKDELEKDGTIEAMSGPNFSELEIRYTPREGYEIPYVISGRNYKKSGGLFG